MFRDVRRLIILGLLLGQLGGCATPTIPSTVPQDRFRSVIIQRMNADKEGESKSRLGQAEYPELVKKEGVLLSELERLNTTLIAIEAKRKSGSLSELEKVEEAESLRSKTLKEAELARVRKRILELEDQILVNKIDAIGGALKTSNWIISAAKRDCNLSVEHAGERTYFSSPEAYRLWLELRGPRETRIDYYAEKDPYISQCLKRLGVGDTEFKRVHQANFRYCGTVSKPATLGVAHYDLGKKDGRIQIKTSIFLNYKGLPENKSLSIQRVMQTEQCVKDFFVNHGIDFDLRLLDDSQAGNERLAHHSVDILDYFERDHSHSWSALGAFGAPKSSDELCKVMTHEVGHLLGLPDQYPDPDCPSRNEIGPVDAVMHKHMTPGAKFYPNDIKKMLGPLCGD